MTDGIVVIDSGQVLETTESAIIAKEEADRAEQWAKYSEEQANLASDSAISAATSRDAAAQSAQSAANTVNGFDAHAAEKQSAFDTNAAQKTQAFNDNAQSKTNTFNTNAAQKQAAVDASAENARKWAVGTISEQPQGSAKYWAENAKAVTEGTLNETLITNCITKIPQDIKLELSNGTLTLKAGSKVYVPNGLDGTTPKFDYITVETDVNINKYGTGNTDFFLCYNFTNNILLANSNTNSGNTETTSEGFTYNTSTNKITFYGTTGNIVSQNVSFPIALCSRSSGTPTSINQIFNGFGYIGSTVFALPGVEVLISDGRNTDGRLNNKKFTIPSVILDTTDLESSYFTIGTGTPYFTRYIRYIEAYECPNTTYTLWYNIGENRMYQSLGDTTFTKIYRTPISLVKRVNGKVNYFNPKSVFRAVDYWEYDQDAAKLNKDNTFNGIVTAFANPINFVAKGKMVKGQTPSGNVFCGYDFQDTNNERLAYLGINYGSSGTKRLELQKQDSNLTEFYTNFVMKATTPADNASGTEVTTAQWVRKYGAQLDYAKGVTISGNGDKTASSNGVLMINASSQNNQGNEQVTLVVEGQTFYFGNGTVDLDVPHIGQVYFPLKAGQKYNITSPNWSKITAKFFPYA